MTAKKPHAENDSLLAQAMNAPQKTEPDEFGSGAPSNPGPNSLLARPRRLGYAPPRYRKLYMLAWEGKSRKAAIRIHCLECVAWSPAEVRRCTCPACSLFQFRLRG